MIRKMLALFVGAMALSLAAVNAADEKKADAKATTFEGKLVCAKCTLGETAKCQHALIVKDGDKKVTYMVDDKNANHKAVCPAGTELDAKVTGKVVEKDGKKTITMAKVELKK